MANVTIYTREMCGYCARAKSLLVYTEHDASYSPALRKEMTERARGASTFPQIFINDFHVGGCDDLHALERAGKLDPLLAN